MNNISYFNRLKEECTSLAVRETPGVIKMVSFLSVRSYFGLAGVSRRESQIAKAFGLLFEWLTLGVAIWLPVQWYLEYHQYLVFPWSSIIDWGVWIVFFVETILMLTLVEKKLYYLGTNWMNIVIILFLFPGFWVKVPLLGSIRALKVIMALFMAIPWITNTGGRFLEESEVRSTLVVFVVVFLLSGLLITTFNSGIQNPLEGLWWTAETVTTVGYGDVVPKTWAGKAFAVVVMFIGMILSSILTANISSYLIGRKNKESQDKTRQLLLKYVLETQKNVEEMRAEVSGVKKNLSDLKEFMTKQKE
jgi:voltage-gated potassium channel